MNMDTAASSRLASRVEVTNAFLRSVYNWMALGLGITAVVSWVLTATDLAYFFYTGTGRIATIVCIIAELGLVFYLSARISKLSGGAATGLFLGYSALSGVTLAPILMVYTASSVATAFFSTAGMFAVTSLYGLVTKRDLSGVGSFCIMGVWGLLIACVVNMFLGSSMLSLGISCIGVVIFVGLTAYDTQVLKEMGETVPQNDAVAVRRGVIIGALKLYLDFINLFIMLLRLIGDRR